jgi:hypothetical protein
VTKQKVRQIKVAFSFPSKQISTILFTFHVPGSVVSSDSGLTTASMNPFRHFGRTNWTGDRLILVPLPTQGSTT